jgi:hypothetical protein
MHGAEKELRVAVENVDMNGIVNETQSKTPSTFIEWKFIPPASPHYGGC